MPVELQNHLNPSIFDSFNEDTPITCCNTAGSIRRGCKQRRHRVISRRISVDSMGSVVTSPVATAHHSCDTFPVTAQTIEVGASNPSTIAVIRTVSVIKHPKSRIDFIQGGFTASAAKPWIEVILQG